MAVNPAIIITGMAGACLSLPATTKNKNSVEPPPLTSLSGTRTSGSIFALPV